MPLTRSKAVNPVAGSSKSPAGTSSSKEPSTRPSKPAASKPKPPAFKAKADATTNKTKKRKTPPTNTKIVIKRHNPPRRASTSSSLEESSSSGDRVIAGKRVVARKTRCKTKSATPERRDEPQYPHVFWKTDHNPKPPMPSEEMPADGPERVEYVLRIAAAINTINAQEKLASPSTFEDTMPWKSQSVQLDFPVRQVRSTPLPPRKGK